MRFLAVIVVLAMLLSVSSLAQNDIEVDSPSALGSARVQSGLVASKKSLRELVEQAETIVVGSVTSVLSYKSPNLQPHEVHPDAVEVSVEVNETFKGPAKLTVKYHGARESLKVSTGDRVLVFLRKPANGVVVPVGIDRGHFKITSMASQGEFFESAAGNSVLWSAVNPLWEIAPKPVVRDVLMNNPSIGAHKTIKLLRLGDNLAEAEPLPLSLLLAVLRAMPNPPSE